MVKNAALWIARQAYQHVSASKSLTYNVELDPVGSTLYAVFLATFLYLTWLGMVVLMILAPSEKVGFDWPLVFILVVIVLALSVRYIVVLAVRNSGGVSSLAAGVSASVGESDAWSIHKRRFFFILLPFLGISLTTFFCLSLGSRCGLQF